MRTTLRARPEKLTGRSHLVRRKVVQQLNNLVVKVLGPGEASPANTVVERVRAVVDERALDAVQRLHRLASGQLQRPLHELRVRQVVVSVLGVVLEVAFEQITGPLQGVFDGVREILRKKITRTSIYELQNEKKFFHVLDYGSEF